MKKKIKDLTLQEILNICAESKCVTCRINNICGIKPYGFLGSVMQKEIEVEKDE